MCIFIGNTVLGPFTIMGSMVIDLLTLPNILFENQETFEHKYIATESPLTEEQVIKLDSLFKKFLYTNDW